MCVLCVLRARSPAITRRAANFRLSAAAPVMILFVHLLLIDVFAQIAKYLHIHQIILAQLISGIQLI